LSNDLHDLGSVIQERHGSVLTDLLPVPTPPRPSVQEQSKEEEAKVPEVESPTLDLLDSEDVVIVEQEAPQLLSVEEAKENPIKALAQELKVQVATWTTDGNPIVFHASEISRYMGILSLFSLNLRDSPTPEAKKGFINAAKDILLQTNAFAEPARKLAEKCSDKRLRKQLGLTLEKISTLAQQLKIVAAVKASSPRDTDPDQQLIACAQNLMVAVKTALKECESAALRYNAEQRASVPGKNPPGDTLKFRKMVYRGLKSVPV
jgi:vinculin